MKVSGYVRSDGQVGIRNYIAIISTVSCANHVADLIANKTNSIPITHWGGCSQHGEDREQTSNIIIGTAMNPNVGAVLFVGLGCEQLQAEEVASQIIGKPVDFVVIQKLGGTTLTVESGVTKVLKMKEEISKLHRTEIDISNITIAVECGGSDSTSGLASNPSVGYASDYIVDAGGSVIMSEIPGLLGSEQALAKRFVNPEDATKLYDAIDFYRQELWHHFKTRIWEGNPTPGNIAGGITTLGEKSIGNIKKGGHSPIQGILKIGERPSRKGLWLADTPGHDPVSVTSKVACGAQIVVFVSGRGSCLGNAIAPVIKVTGNSRTFETMEENIDINAGTVLEGAETLKEVGLRIYNEIIEVANGKLTKAEKLGHHEFALARIGSTV